MSRHLSYLLIFAAIAIIASAYFLGCPRKPAEATIQPDKAEATRAQLINSDSLFRAGYDAGAKEQRSKDSTNKVASAIAKGKDKVQTEKARQSASVYANSGSLPDCDQALKDCQAENATKANSLDIQEQQLADYEAGKVADVSEIHRQRGVSDSLNAGWKAANQGNAILKADNERLEKKAGKQWGLGVSAGYGITPVGLQPTLNLSVNYNLIRF